MHLLVSQLVIPRNLGHIEKRSEVLVVNFQSLNLVLERGPVAESLDLVGIKASKPQLVRPVPQLRHVNALQHQNLLERELVVVHCLLHVQLSHKVRVIGIDCLILDLVLDPVPQRFDLLEIEANLF